MGENEEPLVCQALYDDFGDGIWFDHPLVAHTAELIPGARLEVIDGMAHRPPPAVWPTITGIWSSFAASL